MAAPEQNIGGGCGYMYCAEKFDTAHSPLTKFAAADIVINIMAEEEKYSSSKTCINNLLALFKGFNIDATLVVHLLFKFTKSPAIFC